MKSTITKAISLVRPYLTSADWKFIAPKIMKYFLQDHLTMDDEFDQEFTRLAEARSNPHLLDIGDHMNRSTSHEEIKEMMREGDKSTVDDLARSKSIDDLLMF